MKSITTIYKSHLETRKGSSECSFFRYNNQMYSQSTDDFIHQSKFGIHKNVKMLTVFFSDNQQMLIMDDVDNYIYGKAVQLKLHKQYLKVLAPEKHQKSRN